MGTRIEKDSMGSMHVDNSMLYGASTQRAVLNFPVSGWKMPLDFIHALGIIKAASALSNKQLKKLDAKNAQAIVDASLQVVQGKYDNHFAIDVFQTGSGTSSNMNANEVIANIANLKLGGKVGSKHPIHPNDHVNMGQSSNDAVPTAMHIATYVTLKTKLIPALKALEKTLLSKAIAYKKIIKIGRTHLQDATPITLGQEFSGYAGAVGNNIKRIEATYPLLSELALGGTAVGTGINTHPQFAKRAIQEISKITKIKFKEAENHFEAQSHKDSMLEVSGALKTLAASLTKIANDIRWLSSGPRCGFSEIEIAATQPGSSIMPGKINPVIAESLLQVCAQVIGNDAAITIGVQAGNFELNVMMPLIICNLLNSIKLLTNGVTIFEEKCVRGIEANVKNCENTIEKSLALCTALVPLIGYDKAAELSKKAYKTGKTIREICLEEKVLSEKELQKALDPSSMLFPK
ncbi:MAG: class II fumarate hydratase [Deltaproteobacteria bacterium]|nr:class II fumarate hydratase [Deltaproteobacteria bacterium]